ALLTLEAPVGGDRAVRHQHSRPAVALAELELDQLRLVGLVVPDPGENQPARRFPNPVLAARARPRPRRGIAKDEVDPAPASEIALRRRGLPSRHAVKPAP